MPEYHIKIDPLLCQGHGVCAEECPEVFEVNESETGYAKVRVKMAMPGEELRGAVEDAVKYCPNGTIKIVEVTD